jgi:predicted RNA-binding Zn-ribbon protein involved in translation (DUF1610 family)
MTSRKIPAICPKCGSSNIEITIETTCIGSISYPSGLSDSNTATCLSCKWKGPVKDLVFKKASNG